MNPPDLAVQLPVSNEAGDVDKQAPNTIGGVVVVSDSLPNRNGVGAYYADLLDQLRQEGYDATLLSPSPDKRSLLKFPLPGDATQRIWIPSLFHFRRVMRSVRPKTVIIATPGPFGLLGAWWARRLGARLVVGFHTDYAGVTDLYQNRILRRLSRAYFDLADKILLQNADLVLGNSQAMLDLASSLGAKRCELMGTLLPTDALQPAVASVRQRLSHVIFAGRLAPEKRIDTVIDAARKLPDIQFTIAGDGPLRHDIEVQARELPNVDYVGWVSRDELLSRIDRADLLVLPSYVESFGTVALEAMARGRLALVSNVCGIVDWPTLEPCLYQISKEQSTTAALRQIAELPSAIRFAKARRARSAALQLNQHSLQHWVGILNSQRAQENAA
jgi:glycosyltransferase involved in cell wall biosynthesis